MKDNLIKVCMASPEITLGDPLRNAEKIYASMKRASEEGCFACVFPELCLTGSTCGDMYENRALLSSAQSALDCLVKKSKGLNCVYLIGSPVLDKRAVYNSCFVIFDGRVWGRSDCADPENTIFMRAFEKSPLFSCGGFTFEVKIGDDIKNMDSACADLVINPCSIPKIAGDGSNEKMYEALGALYGCGIAVCSAGEGESVTDSVKSGLCAAFENFKTLAKSDGYATAVFDLDIIRARRYSKKIAADDRAAIPIPVTPPDCDRVYSIRPFHKDCGKKQDDMCREAVSIQVSALCRRALYAKSDCFVIAVSGGLDSTLALIDCVLAADKLRWDREKVIAITMPGFGTTGRTYANAMVLMKSFGVTIKEISIVPAMELHFMDISLPEGVCNTAFENAQARERTQIAMDIANMENGIQIGTSDLSEIALGFSTYNGDHMGMYMVNSSVPKTLMRTIVDFAGREYFSEKTAEILTDIINTPVSPELLPADGGRQGHHTEDLLGSYELHDFFIYYTCLYNFAPSKTYRAACRSFVGKFNEDEIKHALKIFCRRYITQQFKRSCSPDSPQVTEVSLSPRGGLAMPSDMSPAFWENEIESL